MTITTNIPATRVPGQYMGFDSSKALTGLASVPQRALILGQMLPTGTAAPLAPVQIFSGGQGYAAFGAGSQIGQEVESFYNANPVTELWAVGVSDLLAGVAATYTATVTGPAAASGTLPLYVEGVAVPVGVTAGDTAAVIAANIATAVGAALNLSVAAVAAAAVVTLTARHKGLCGNSIDIRVGYYPTDVIPAGVAVAVATATVGAGNPDITTIWPVLGDKQFNSIIVPWTDGATQAALFTELSRRWGPLVQSEGMAYSAITASMSQAAAQGAGLNSPYLSILPVRRALTSPWRAAAIYGAVIAYYGAIDPAAPFETLPLSGMKAPAQSDKFTRQERDLLLHDGMSSFTVDHAGVCYIERAITTYQTNPVGAPDISWLDVNTPLTLATLRYQARLRIATKFPRYKLADDGTNFGPGQNVMTPRLMRTELLALAAEWEDAGLIEDLAQFAAGLRVERDASNPNQMNAVIDPNLVNQFQNFSAVIQFIL